MANLNINAQNALAELRGLISEVRALKKELNDIKGSNADSFTEIENKSKRLKQQISLLGNRINYLKAIIDKQNVSMNNSAKATNKDTLAKKKNTSQTKNQIKSNISLIGSLQKLLSLFGIIGGIALFGNILRETYQSIKTFDSLGFALERVTKTIEDYNNSNRFLLSLTQDYGVELISTTNRWIKFLAAARNAGLALGDAENIFRSMTKAAGVLGLKTDELQGIYLALEQMLSKGKVTTEELRRQLGERLPGAMGIMAASIGVTIPKLDEMLRKGEVLSADVLPKFADAVEVAFGIENVEKIDTIVAAENRAIAAWQNFVKQISGSDTLINKALRNILNGFADLSNRIGYVFASDEQKLQSVLAEEEKIIFNRLKAWSKARLSQQEEYYQLEEKLRKEIQLSKDRLNRTSNKKERDELQSHLDKLQSDLVLYSQKVKETNKEIAKEKFDDAVLEYDKLRELRLKGLAAADKAEKESFGQYNEFQKFIRQSSIKEKRQEAFLKATGKTIKQMEAQYVNAAAAYNVYRKLIEESNVQLPDEKDKPKRRGRRELELKKILDLEKQIQIEIAKTNIEKNKSLINSDSTTFEERIKLSKDNNKLLNRIEELSYEIEVDKAEKAKDEKLRAIEKAEEKGVKIIGDVEQQKTDIIEEFKDKQIIAEEQKNKAIIKNNERTSEEVMRIVDDVNKHALNKIQDPFNLEAAALKRNYELSRKTARDKEILQEGLKRVAIDAANAQIDAQISILRAQLATGNNSQDQIDAIIMKINELNAAKQNYIKNSNNASLKQFWVEVLDLVSEYNKAIGDLVDASYARRIENINAEIEAERNKYDYLIKLAEDDAAQKEVLERNKQERIEQLEKKRLKQEQKRAKARKAFAVADIAISTAQAIMRAYSDTGPIAGSVFAGIIAALGAVQVAAVLAQPIPKYKDGGNIKKDEIAMINDGVAQEYVKRGNEILTTKTKNAIVGLKKDDVVYKNYDDMINKELLKPNGIDSIGLSENNFDNMFLRFEDSIEKGFKKAKINNIIKVINKQEDNSYSNNISRWS